MRIIVDTRLLTRGAATGIPGYTRELLGELIRQNPDDSFVLFFNAFRKKNPIDSTWQNSRNVTVVNRRIPNRLLSLLLKLTNQPTIERLTNTRDAEVLWSPHLDLLTTTNTPHVVTVHDISFVHHPRFFSKQYHLWSWLQNQLKQAREADRIIAVSNYTKNDLVQTLALPAKKITVIYPGISSVFRPLSRTNNELLAFQKKRALVQPFFLFFGTLEARKNVVAVVQAFSALKEDPRFDKHQLILAGRPGSGFPLIERAIFSSRFQNDIRLLHDIADEERVYLYNSAEAFVFPSFFEGFGFPPLEAQACGVPVVSSLRGSLQEVLGQSALEIDPWRPNTIAQHLRTLHEDSNLRASVIEKGFANTKRFTWSNAAAQTMQQLRAARNTK